MEKFMEFLEGNIGIYDFIVMGILLIATLVIDLIYPRWLRCSKHLKHTKITITIPPYLNLTWWQKIIFWIKAKKTIKELDLLFSELESELTTRRN